MASSHSPNTENLRKQAKALLRAWREHNPNSVTRVSEHYPEGRNFGLQDAQFVLAREYGFRSWSALLEFLPRMGYFTDAYTFHISRAFDVSVDRLWSALSKPEQIGKWLLPVTFEPSVGSTYEFACQPKLAGKIGVYDRHRAIRFDSDADAFWLFEIEPCDEKGSPRIQLTTVDRMTKESVDQYPGGVVEVWNPGVTAGWHQIIDALDHVLTGRQPTDIDYSRICRFYERLLERMIQ